MPNGSMTGCRTMKRVRSEILHVQHTNGSNPFRNEPEVKE